MKAAQADQLFPVRKEKGPCDPGAERVAIDEPPDPLPRDVHIRVHRLARIPRDR